MSWWILSWWVLPWWVLPWWVRCSGGIVSVSSRLRVSVVTTVCWHTVRHAVGRLVTYTCITITFIQDKNKYIEATI